MKTMQDWLDAYAVSHQNPLNKLLHWFCVPLIFMSLIGLLSVVSFKDFLPVQFENLGGFANLGTLLIIFGLIFYMRLSFGMFLGMLVFSVVVLIMVNRISLTFDKSPVYLYLGIFTAAWIGQFIGHKIEGEKPSFFEDVQFLLIGPAWLMSFIYKKLGLKY